jgi:Icc protein
MSPARLFVALLLVVPELPWTQPGDVAGAAYVDANGNGIRDRGEAGLANVVISNQDAVVVTDASGRYRLPRRADGVVCRAITRMSASSAASRT